MSIIYVLVIFSSLQYAECRKSNMEKKILNGVPARIEDFPHSAYLIVELPSFDLASCGGSILNQRVILTAGHCMDGCDECPAWAILGNTNVHGLEGIKITNLIVHEAYDAETFTNDIALVFLEQDITFSQTKKRAIIMPNPPVTSTAQIAGWGLVTGANGIPELTEHLQMTEITIVSRVDCIKFLRKVQKGIFCGNGVKISTVTSGDSGSGLMVNKYIEIGLVSFGIPKQSKTMAAFTNVSEYADWIETQSKAICCKNMNNNTNV